MGSLGARLEAWFALAARSPSAIAIVTRMGWRDLFGHRADTTEELMAQAQAARPPADASSEIERLARSGEKIEAIKLYREQFGVSLADAKDAVDAIARGEAVPSAPDRVTRAAGSDDAVRALIDKGELIDAIKLYREVHDVGLKEAKDAVDAMRA